MPDRSDDSNVTLMEFDEVRVDEYMTTDIETVGPDAWVTDVVDRIKEGSQFNGLPVVDEDEQLLGFVNAIDLLEIYGDESVDEVMTRELVVVRPEMTVKNAARVIFRTGHQFLPVVDEDGELLGMFSNGDAVRSQIERTTPSKVESTRRMLERNHDTSIDVDEREIEISSLIPTQREVYADELEGRKYELKNDLAEPLIAVSHGSTTFLVDGHHRAMAARRLDLDRTLAYVLDVPVEDVDELGFEMVARRGGLDSLADVEVNDYVQHPLIEKTEPDR
ncbi:ParB/RepB/Spo0J family partition protein [Natronoarchaeum mannanilyticum]|uniref:ParB/RepB/Spo0J family partition protein n=2 Tax=Natronoarchaeum mannanilyticum TaxID=926360 RepID=A0AAV3TFJ9_9EURY